MSDFTNHAKNKLIDALLRGQALAAPSTLYFALLLAVNDVATSAVTEVTGGGYARVPVAASLSAFSGTQAAGSTDVSSGASGESSNNAAITFNAPTGGWGQVTHVAVFDAPTAGNAWVIKALVDPKTINNGDPGPQFSIGDFILAL